MWPSEIISNAKGPGKYRKRDKILIGKLLSILLEHLKSQLNKKDPNIWKIKFFLGSLILLYGKFDFSKRKQLHSFLWLPYDSIIIWRIIIWTIQIDNSINRDMFLLTTTTRKDDYVALRNQGSSLPSRMHPTSKCKFLESPGDDYRFCLLAKHELNDDRGIFL